LKEVGHSAKVVMISAVGQDAMIKEAKELGASSYITKPFSPEKVLETLDAILS
ncbi:MAG: response regulator, partial [Flavobacteriales bacterium]|nr:response regulator [Flavobacteriales bacterium]